MKGAVFVQYQGQVLSTTGAPSAAGAASKHAGLAYTPFERFQNNSVKEPNVPNEANAVLRTWWRYMREVWSDIDDRDIIACTVFNGRALLVQSGGPKTVRHLAARPATIQPSPSGT